MPSSQCRAVGTPRPVRPAGGDWLRQKTSTQVHQLPDACEQWSRPKRDAHLTDALRATNGEPGRRKLNRSGIAPDPGSRTVSTIGGNVATSAVATRLKYGTMRECILGLEAVLGTGDVMRTGARLAKDVGWL